MTETYYPIDKSKTEKLCPICNKVLAITNFSICHKNKDGYAHICKSCYYLKYRKNRTDFKEKSENWLKARQRIEKEKEALVGTKIKGLFIHSCKGFDSKGDFYVFCLCSCGNPNPFAMRLSDLKNPKLKPYTCGSCRYYEALNNVKKKIGHLIIKEVLKEDKSYTGLKVKCLCDCGREKILSYSRILQNLKNGYIVSCGECSSYWKAKSFLGTKWGKLTIKSIKDLKPNIYDCTFLCNCDCGTKDVVLSYATMMQKYHQSCGCLTCSLGELEIKNFLDKHSILYEREKSFKTLFNPKTGSLLFFDFFVPKCKLLIEFQGSQHYKQNKFFHRQEKEFEDLKYRDELKKQWALDNGYVLLEFKEEDRNKTITSKLREVLCQD